MTASWWTGAVLGLLAGLGVVVAVRASPPMRPVRLADRIAPYLGDTPPPSRLLARPEATAAPFVVVRRLFGPVLGEAVGVLDRVLGGRSAVRRRLAGLGSSMTVEDFRIEQVLWAAVGAVAAAGSVGGGTLLRGRPEPLLILLAAIGGLLAGALGRDWWLSRQLERREQAMLSEFPVVADLLALSVVAGESPVEALERVCRLTGGELARDLRRALDRARAGKPVAAALGGLADETTLESFARFLQGLVVAIERGTPLADVLRAQAVDVREVGKRALLEAGGRKEISMMAPVVFLILPVTVLFALFPGLLTLTSLAR
ncbi:tight adherence protein C [Jatrophihabitans endophyticus]|uniref:Tight adherence protein C n=1 Tax=Jatrophihabitans endophyticus TaxID=1206085 RepID=A0A1M5RSE7_9ACTN|nr:type II secretion system F family protein [Jatrophihabitans endophyticus]SHH29204.1 tight adherence protein C [Jatrophihabitans endophyticus]